MTVRTWLMPVYKDTPVELQVDFNLLFKGTAEEAILGKYFNREVQEAYISPDGLRLTVSVAPAPPVPKPKKKMGRPTKNKV